MLNQAKEVFLFRTGKSSKKKKEAATRSARQVAASSNEEEPTRAPQAPPTPKVKKQKLRSCSSSSLAAAAAAGTTSMMMMMDKSITSSVYNNNDKNRKHSQTNSSSQANSLSTSTSGYQSTSGALNRTTAAAAAAAAATKGDYDATNFEAADEQATNESINRDYSNLLFLSSPSHRSLHRHHQRTTSTPQVAEVNPALCHRPSGAALGAPTPPKQWSASSTTTKTTTTAPTACDWSHPHQLNHIEAADAADELDLESSQTGNVMSSMMMMRMMMMTPNHATDHQSSRQLDRQRRQHHQRHFYDTNYDQHLHQQQQQQQPQMIPMMIDDDDDDDVDDDDEVDMSLSADFCQFSGGAGDVDARFYQQQQPSDSYLRQHHCHPTLAKATTKAEAQSSLIDGHYQQQQQQSLWRQRQAQSLGEEVRQKYFAASSGEANLFALNLDDNNNNNNNNDQNQNQDQQQKKQIANNYLTYQLANQHRVASAHHATTKRMLIAASQLNNQQKLYKQQPFDHDLIDQQQQLQFSSLDLNNYLQQQHKLENNQQIYFTHTPNIQNNQPTLQKYLNAMSQTRLNQNNQQLSSLSQHIINNENNHQQTRSISPHQQVRRSKSASRLQQQQQLQSYQLTSSSSAKQLNNIQQQFLQPAQLQANNLIMAHQPSSSQFNNNNSLQATNSNSRRSQHNHRSQHHKSSKHQDDFTLSCCGKLAKLLLFLANTMFWSAGVGLGAWGILALVDDHKYNLSQLLVFDQGTRMSLFQLLSWSFITLGCATILVGFCGCSAMFKNNRWILGLYIFLILAIFALDLATGLLAMIFQERLIANVRLRLVGKLKQEYGIQASFTAAIDYIQTRYECCGLEGHFDYDQSLWRLQRLGGFEATVARTCCHLRNTFDDQAHVNPRPVNESMCQSTDVRFHQSYRYRRGCLDDLERLIRNKIWTFTVGCGAVGAIILLSLMFATCFCRSIPQSRNKNNNNSPTNRQNTQQQIASLTYLVNHSVAPGENQQIPTTTTTTTTTNASSGQFGQQQMVSSSKKQGHSVAHYR